MIRLTRVCRRRTVGECALVTAAIVARLCARVLVRLVRFGRVRRWSVAALPLCARRGAADPAREAAVLWAIRTASVIVPLRDGCLADAVAAHWLLAAAGIESTIRFGVARLPGARSLAAHAWLERDGAILVGAAAAAAFHPLD